jgi:uncharacterized protein (TIGR00369 family)
MSDPGVPPTAVLGDPDSWGEEHRREVSWHDPSATLGLSATMSGLDYLTAMKNGRLPSSPIGMTAGMEAVSVAVGDVVFRCVADASFLNPIGIIHGGLLSTLLDSVLGCAVHTTLPAGTGYTSIELKVSFLRAVAPGDELTAHGWVVKPGRRVAFAEATLTGPDGKLAATANSSLLIMGG